MKILDVDMDYFMDSVAEDIPDDVEDRLPEDEYGEFVWSEGRVRYFLENHLGLSKISRIKGRVVKGHNEALLFWKELISNGMLTCPFEVIHVDSHADLGQGYHSDDYILNQLLGYPVEERPMHNRYIRPNGKQSEEGIGDYLLWAVAYRWIKKITYCGNASVLQYRKPSDYYWYTLKDFQENLIWNRPVENIIQLAYNVKHLDMPYYDDSPEEKALYLDSCIREPQVPLLVIPTVEDVNFSGAFDYIVFAQSPNYTPASADFMLDIFREYIIEI